MEAELIVLISLLGMMALCSCILAKIKSGTLCYNSRITPLVGEHSGNIPGTFPRQNIPGTFPRQRTQMFSKMYNNNVFREHFWIVLNKRSIKRIKDGILRTNSRYIL